MQAIKIRLKTINNIPFSYFLYNSGTIIFTWSLQEKNPAWKAIETQKSSVKKILCY